MIAADINGDGKVNGADLVELRKLILGVYLELPDNTSWRFVQSDFEFQDSSNPWLQEFDETYEISGLDRDMDIDFIGVKIGDVDNTAVTNTFHSSVDMKNHRWPLTLEVPIMQIEADAVIRIPVFAKNYEQIQGWQMTLSFAAKEIEILSVESGALDFDASHYNIANQSEGWMTMSYGSEQLEDITEDEVLFEIVVKAENNIDVAEVFKIASSVTQAEAYRGHFDIVNVDLKPRAMKESKILSINPNPWISSCNIEFSLAEDADGIWEFYDVNGRLIYSKQAAYKSGTHIMHVNRENINTTGIVYIKFSSAQSVFESRMMIVD